MKLLADLPINVRDELGGTEIAPLMVEERFNFPSFVALAIRLLLIGIAVSSFIFLLWGSLQWITSGGDKDGVEKAKRKITNALIGLFITFSLFAIFSLINVLFGINLAGDISLPTL
jgi:hypothetical protein